MVKELTSLVPVCHESITSGRVVEIRDKCGCLKYGLLEKKGNNKEKKRKDGFICV
jgi:hypothetical protein